MVQLKQRHDGEQELFIALGSNLGSRFGDPVLTIAAALKALGHSGFTLTKVSRFFRTPAFPKGNGPDYCNACAALRGSGQATEMLARLHRIEADFGRERVQRWGARSLDLDLIAVAQQVVPDRETFKGWHALPPSQQVDAVPDALILPHPRIQDRGFVLVPLADIAPDWRHPVLNRTVREMCDALPPEARAEPVAI